MKASSPDPEILDSKRGKPNPLRRRYRKEAAEVVAELIHSYGKGVVCETDARGHPTPEGRSPLEIVVDASEGFIPLWDRNVTLRWRFQERAMSIFRDPDAAKDYLRALFGLGLELWGDAVPVRFTERHDAWDFELVVHNEDSCTANGCTLARAFFPDGGRHELVIYPKMFEQSAQEQIETIAHELGHVFGLRHFFADVAETAWPIEIFGEHDRFSIMNYGADSVMTDSDRNDLAALYRAVWDGTLTDINGTPIRQFTPYSANRVEPECLPVAAMHMR